MTTFDKREEPFERQFVHDEVAGSRPSRAAISGSGSGRPGGWAGPAPKLSPSQANWPPSNSSITGRGRHGERRAMDTGAPRRVPARIYLGCPSWLSRAPSRGGRLS